MTNTKKIFHASSTELTAERDALSACIALKSKRWQKEHDTSLELVGYEDVPTDFSLRPKQEEYNRLVQECDIFVMLVSAKLGSYTEEEFETAYRELERTGKRPVIYFFFKETPQDSAGGENEGQQRLSEFKERVEKKLRQFYVKYQNEGNLKDRFSEELDKLASRPGFFKPPEGQEGSISSENSIDRLTPAGNRAIDPSLSAVPRPQESTLLTPEKPSCYVLITKEKSFLHQIVEELKKHPELKGKIKHQEPQVRTHDDPEENAKMNDEDYAKFLVGFFAAEASQYKWLVTNLPWQQERYFADVIFEKFAKAEDKFCILIESGHGIPNRWKSWKAEHKWCQRSSFPFLVIETNHQEAAAQLIERAAARGILPLRVDKLAVLSVFPPKDRSADTRASIYHECFGPQLSVGDQDGTGRNTLSVSAPNLNFFRWEVEGFDRRQTADALRRNKKALDAARDADHMVFFCGNDEMAEEIVQFMSPRGPRHVGSNRHSKYTIFGFDGSMKQEAISNTGFHFLTAAPNLEAMCGCAANFIADPDARICAEDPCRRISAKEPLWFKPSLG